MYRARISSCGDVHRVRILNWIPRVSCTRQNCVLKFHNWISAVIDANDLFREFLLAVVNADDRSPLPERRLDFARRYEKWFPPKEGQLYKKSVYKDDLQWWKLDGLEIPDETPHPEFGLHVAGLRYKLRVIWIVANSKEWESAERKVGYLLTDIQRYYRLPQEGTLQPWRVNIRRACKWLESNVKRLKICKNPMCESRYFIGKDKNQQYCKPGCSADGQSLGGPSQHEPRLTEEGKKAVSEAVTKRHAQNRLKKQAQEP